jgi:hypothetical protein
LICDFFYFEQQRLVSSTQKLHESKNVTAGEPTITMSVASRKYKVPPADGWKEKGETGSQLRPQHTLGLEQPLQSHLLTLMISNKKM